MLDFELVVLSPLSTVILSSRITEIIKRGFILTIKKEYVRITDSGTYKGS